MLRAHLKSLMESQHRQQNFTWVFGPVRLCKSRSNGLESDLVWCRRINHILEMEYFTTLAIHGQCLMVDCCFLRSHWNPGKDCLLRLHIHTFSTIEMVIKMKRSNLLQKASQWKEEHQGTVNTYYLSQPPLRYSCLALHLQHIVPEWDWGCGQLGRSEVKEWRGKH